MRKSRQPGQKVCFPLVNQVWESAACCGGSAPVDTDRITGLIHVGWRWMRHHVEPSAAMLLHQAVRGAGGVVAFACVIRSQHTKQARQPLAVGGNKHGAHVSHPNVGAPAWA
jgi:hypothetical protein